MWRWQLSEAHGASRGRRGPWSAERLLQGWWTILTVRVRLEFDRCLRSSCGGVRAEMLGASGRHVGCRGGHYWCSWEALGCRLTRPVYLDALWAAEGLRAGGLVAGLQTLRVVYRSSKSHTPCGKAAASIKLRAGMYMFAACSTCGLPVCVQKKEDIPQLQQTRPCRPPFPRYMPIHAYTRQYKPACT